MKLWIAISARETSQNEPADPANRPRATRRRELRAKKKMSVSLNPQQKTTPPLMKNIKIVSTTRKTTAKIPCSPIPKTLRKNIHRGTKANSCHRICWRGLTTTIKLMTEPVPRTTTAAATELAPATTEVTGISAPEEDLRNG